MKITRAYKTELNPNNVQKTALFRHAGAARWVYNWGLKRRLTAYQEDKRRISWYTLHKDLIVLKNMSSDLGGVPWLYDVSKCVAQYALMNLGQAYDNFYNGFKEGGARKGLPCFKSKKRGVGSFTVNQTLSVTSSRIKLPKIGYLKLKEKNYLPTKDRLDVRVLFATVSENAGRWYVSLTVEQEIPDPIPVEDSDKHIVGVDVVVKDLAVTSEGEVFENPKAYNKAQKRLRMLDKAVARKKKGSKNQKKALKKRAKQHQKIANIRKDNQHKASTAITKSADVIVVESLNVKGMMRNRKLSKALADASLSEFLRQLKYKAKWAGKQVIEANRWYPSSKTCSNFGSVKDPLGLEERTFNCDDCGFSIDRDLNAAINLKNLAGSSPVSACCPGASTSNATGSGQTPVGQEPNASLEG